MSLLVRLRTAPATFVPGAVALGAVLAVGVAFAAHATGRLSTGGTFPVALTGLVVVGALTRRFGIALPGNGFSSYVLGVTTFAILERGWEFVALVAPLLTVLGDVVLRRLPLRLAASNAAHLTAGSSLAGIIYERLGGATGVLALEPDNVGPIAALLGLMMVIVNGSFYLELALTRSIAWLDARLTARWETIVAKGTKHARMVPAGARVVAGPLAAMFDPEAIEMPWRFCSSRALGDFLHFGHGERACFGKYVADTAMTEVVRALVRLPDLRRAAWPEGRIRYHGPVARSLALTFCKP